MQSKRSTWVVDVYVMDTLNLAMSWIRLVLEHGSVAVNTTPVETRVIVVVKVLCKRNGLKLTNMHRLNVNVINSPPLTKRYNAKSLACNCHNHATKCVYDPEIDEQHLSLDIHGRYEGGGQCLECEHNTEGINCNKCKSGFYRPAGKHWNETDVCRGKSFLHHNKIKNVN
jgi:hypothetical protein